MGYSDGGFSCSGPTYGSYSAPVNIGSGGDNFAGGGAVILTISNTLTVNGSILAEGSANTNFGAGSGGSIFITAPSLTGSGLLSAISANESNAVEGGGGRIAVIATTTSWNGTMRAYGNLTSVANTSAAGTIFIQPPSTHGTLIVNNNNNTSTVYTTLSSGTYNSSSFDYIQLNQKGQLWMPYPSTFTITATNVLGDGTTGVLRLDGLLTAPASLSISSYTLMISSFSTVPALTYLDIGYAGGFNLGGNNQTPVVNLSSITIENNGLLTHWANSTTGAGETHKLNLTLTNFVVNAGGQVNATGLGYTAGQGPGIGAGTYAGSYGGQGGADTTPGATYGNYNAPVNIGSGGASGATGGGAVILNISNTLTVNGLITVDCNNITGKYGG